MCDDVEEPYLFLGQLCLEDTINTTAWHITPQITQHVANEKKRSKIKIPSAVSTELRRGHKVGKSLALSCGRSAAAILRRVNRLME